MPWTPRRRAATLALVLLTAALPVAAEGWDGERAIALASELASTLDTLVATAETAAPQETAMQQRTRDAAVLEMKNARDLGREYATKIRGGWSRDDSEFFFSQLRRATRQARERARDAVPDPNVAPHLERMDTLLAELSALYQRD